MPTEFHDLWGSLHIGDTADYKNQLAAAETAGISSVAAHPSFADPLDNPQAVEELLRNTAFSRVAVRPVGALTAGLRGEGLTAYSKLKAAGCIAVGQGNAPLPAAPVLRRAFEYAASCQMPIWLRPEDTELAAKGFAHEGAIGTRLGLKGIPVIAETVAMNLLIALAEQTGAELHLSRLSSAAGVEILRSAQQRGLAITADVAIDNLLYTDAELEGYNSRFHVTPVLRSAADRDALRNAVKDGSITTICSNHCPQPGDAKIAPFPETTPGANIWPQLSAMRDQLD